MKKTQREAILLTLPDEVKTALVEEVERTQSNTNDVVVATIAARLDLPFLASGRRSIPSDESPVVMIRVSKKMKRAVQLAALRSDENMTSLVVKWLIEELELDTPLPCARRRTPFGGGKRAA